RVQVRPAPDTVTVCLVVPPGPSEATKATSVSPAAAVWNAGVVTAPVPCTLTWTSMMKHGWGGAGFCTVTGTLAAVATLPLVSVALALSVWPPAAAGVGAQGTALGGEVTGLPSGWPSSRNCTDATATLSLAFAATGTVPDSVWFAVGLVRLTVGGVVSAVWVGVGVGVVGVGVGV